MQESPSFIPSKEGIESLLWPPSQGAYGRYQKNVAPQHGLTHHYDCIFDDCSKILPSTFSSARVSASGMRYKGVSLGPRALHTDARRQIRWAMQYRLKTASNLRNPRGIKKAMAEFRHSEHIVFNGEFTRVQKFYTFISPHERTSTERLPAGRLLCRYSTGMDIISDYEH
jgi:hypothetical protein